MTTPLLRALPALALALACAPLALAQPWTYDFGQVPGIYTEPSTTSTEFGPPPPSGTAFYRIGNTGGGFVLDTPGSVIGSGSELRMVPARAGSLNKFAVRDYGSPSPLFTTRFTIRFETAASGEWVFAQGDGTSFGDVNGFEAHQSAAAFRLTFGPGGAIATELRRENAWVALEPSPFAQGDEYRVEIFGNNGTADAAYEKAGPRSVAPQSYDLWVNGHLVADDVPTVNGLAANANVDSFMFYGLMSTGNAAVVRVDDLRYEPALGERLAADVSQMVTGEAGWRMLAAPVEGLTLADLDALNALIGFPGATPESLPNLYLAYDGTYGSGNGGWTNGYFNPPGTSTATALASGAGFIWYFYDSVAAGGDPLPDPLVAAGFEPNDGVVLDVSGNADGFYLLGNPYAAGLRLDQLVQTRGDIQNNVYVWDPAAGSGVGGFAVLDVAAGDVAAPWQGFLVESFGPATQLTAPLPARTDGGPFIGLTADATGKARGPAARLDFTLVGADAAGNRSFDGVTRLAFHPAAEAGWDLFDGSEPPAGFGAAGRLAVRGARGREVVYHGVDARLSPQAATDYPLALDVARFAGPATFTLTWTGLDALPAGWSATLHDHAAGRAVTLRPGGAYAFTSDATRGWTDRFSLRLAPTATDEAALTAVAGPTVEVFPNPAVAGAQVVVRTVMDEAVRVEVFDALGRRVATVYDGPVEAGASRALALDAAALAPGAYVVRVTGETFAETRRLTVAR